MTIPVCAQSGFARVLTMEAFGAGSPHPATQPRRWRGGALALIVLALLGVGGWQLWARWPAREGKGAVIEAEVERGDLVSSVTATGLVNPVIKVDVGSQVSGQIAELLVDYNEEVKAGQVIARLDPQLFESAVAQSRARLKSARANLARTRALAENAAQQHKRVADMAQSGVAASAEVDTAVADERSATAQVDAAVADVTLSEASLEQAEVNLRYTTIASPIDGVVISRSVAVGQTVAASLSAPTLFVIAGDLRKMEVHVNVAESDVGKITVNMRAKFTVDAFPDREFYGNVRQVRYEAQTTANVVTYDAVVQVDNAKLELRPGMTANVTFITEERKDVLMVPNKAMRYRPPDAPREEGGPGGNRGDKGGARGNKGGGRGDKGGAKGTGKTTRTVWVQRGGRPQPVLIETGLTDGTNTEVVSGDLREGDKVIVGEADDDKKKASERRRPPRVL